MMEGQGERNHKKARRQSSFFAVLSVHCMMLANKAERRALQPKMLRKPFDSALVLQ
jgi:hypothetical protein